LWAEASSILFSANISSLLFGPIDASVGSSIGCYSVSQPIKRPDCTLITRDLVEDVFATLYEGDDGSMMD